MSKFGRYAYKVLTESETLGFDSQADEYVCTVVLKQHISKDKMLECENNYAQMKLDAQNYDPDPTVELSNNVLASIDSVKPL